MSKQLQVGADIFDYPTQGENPGWGEEATAWAEAVTDTLGTLSGPNDILNTSATLTNNQATVANISGLSFDPAQVQAFFVKFYIERVFDAGATTVTQSGRIEGNYTGSDFEISIESIGDAGITMSITAAGQAQYISTNLTNHVSSTIRFNAQTIDKP